MLAVPEMALCEAADVRCTDSATREALWRPLTDAGTATCGGEVVRLGFPRGWPDAFKACVPLKRVLTGLRGTRCRVVGPPAPAELAAAVAAGARPLSLRSFDNASRLAQASVGYSVIKGFVVFERLDPQAAGSAGNAPREPDDSALRDDDRVFVGVRHWWNCTLEGTWIDLTPPLVLGLDRMLLVESRLGEKQPIRPSRATCAAADALARSLAAAGGRAVAGTCAITAEGVSEAEHATVQQAEVAGAASAGSNGAASAEAADHAAPGLRLQTSELAPTPMDGAGTSAPPPDAQSTAELPRSESAAAPSPPSPASLAASAARRALEASGAPPASAAAGEAAARAAVALGAPFSAAMRVASLEAVRVARLGLSEGEAADSAATAVRQAAVAPAGTAAAAAARQAGASCAAAAAAEAAAGACILSGGSHAEAAVAAGEAAGRAAQHEAAQHGAALADDAGASGGAAAGVEGRETPASVSGKEETVASISGRLRSEGLVALKAEDLSCLGAKVEAEEDAVRRHGDEVRRARDRLARGVGDAADEVLLLEDPPEAPTAEMMRRATGGRRGGGGGSQQGAAGSDGGGSGGSGGADGGGETGDGSLANSGGDVDCGDEAGGIAQVSATADALLAEAVRLNGEGSRLFKLAVSAVVARGVAGSSTRLDLGEGEQHHLNAGTGSADGRSGGEASTSDEGAATGSHTPAITEGEPPPSELFRRALGCFEAGLAVLGLDADGSRHGTGASASDRQGDYKLEGARDEADGAAGRLAARRSPALVVRLLSNGAAAHHRMGDAASAWACCGVGLRLDPSNAKLLSRRAQAASQLGRHKQACADQWAALKAIRAKANSTGRASHDAIARPACLEEERAAAVALVHVWAARVPAAAGFLLTGLRQAPLVCDAPAGLLDDPAAAGGTPLAFCAALHGEGTARLWARGDGATAAAGHSDADANRLATARAGTLVAAAQAAGAAGDDDAAEALLRTAAWVCGCRGARVAEGALIQALAELSDVPSVGGAPVSPEVDGGEDEPRDAGKAKGRDADARGAIAGACVTRLAVLTSAHAPQQSATAALQLVEALACRRVSNAAQLQAHLIVGCWREGKTDAVRRAAASALVWLSRSRRASGWMAGPGEETLRPLLVRAVALHASCGLSAPWAIDDAAGGEAGEEETGVCLGDGGQ